MGAMEMLPSLLSEISVSVCQTTWHHILRGGTLHSIVHAYEEILYLKFRLKLLVYVQSCDMLYLKKVLA
jgi:hypothetical protein